MKAKSENSISHIKTDGSIEKSSLNFKNNSELEIKQYDIIA